MAWKRRKKPDGSFVAQKIINDYHDIFRLYPQNIPARWAMQSGLDSIVVPRHVYIGNNRFQKQYYVLDNIYNTHAEFYDAFLMGVYYGWAVDSWEREFSEWRTTYVATESDIQRMKEYVYDVFGRPDFFRYKTDCTDCKKVMMYRDFDIYLCSKHTRPDLGQYYEGIMCIVVRYSPYKNHEHVNYWEPQYLMRGKRDQKGLDTGPVARAVAIAHHFVYRNKEKFPEIEPYVRDFAANAVSSNPPLEGTPTAAVDLPQTQHQEWYTYMGTMYQELTRIVGPVIRGINVV
jgi:hypothetical protein